uniref:Uncharacterized protein n=1 Tax=Ditylenchus dipsaci TaxID=166011 RepID=A0A915D7H0_9BILA
MINPTRDLPRAIFISCTICTVVYGLVNVAFYAGTSPEELLNSKAIAVTFADKFYGRFSFIMPILILLWHRQWCYVDLFQVIFCCRKKPPHAKCAQLHQPILDDSYASRLVHGFSQHALSLSFRQHIHTHQLFGLLWLRVKQPPRDYPRPLQLPWTLQLNWDNDDWTSGLLFVRLPAGKDSHSRCNHG